MTNETPKCPECGGDDLHEITFEEVVAEIIKGFEGLPKEVSDDQPKRDGVHHQGVLQGSDNLPHRHLACQGRRGESASGSREIVCFSRPHLRGRGGQLGLSEETLPRRKRPRASVSDESGDSWTYRDRDRRNKGLKEKELCSFEHLFPHFH